MRRSSRSIVVTATLALALGIATSAAAQVPPPPPAPEPTAADNDLRYRWTVMWAPLRAAVTRLAEFTGEYRLNEKFGLMVMAGAGRPKVKFAAGPLSFSLKATEWEGGGQLRFYVLRRNGSELNIAAEFIYERLKFDDPPPFAVAVGGGTLGPLVGYKLVTRVGFTFEAQMGVRYLVMNPPVMGDTSGGSTVAGEKWGLTLHLNVGWSF